MGQGVGELNVSVVARTSKARQNINRFRKDVGRLPDTVQKANRGIGSLSSGLGGLRSQLLGIASIGGAAVVLKQAFREVDNLAKTSNKLGIATEKLAGLQFAAEQTGVGVKTLDTGLQRMVRRVADAAQGSGEAAGALKELGLNAKSLDELSPDKQFDKIAAAMSNVASQSDKVRLGFKLFDSEGVALINTLAAGEKGLRDFQRQAETLGLAIGRAQAADIERANDAINAMTRGLKGLGRQTAAFVAPAVGRLANAWANNFRVLFGGLDAVQSYGTKANTAAINTNKLTDATNKATEAIKRQARVISEREAAQKLNLKTFAGELTALERRASVANIGEHNTKLIDLRYQGINQRGLEEFSRLSDLAKIAERGAEQRRALRSLQKRIRHFGKTPLQAERDEFLRGAVDQKTFDQGRTLFAKLERLEAGQRLAQRLPGALASIANAASGLLGSGKQKSSLSALPRPGLQVLNANSAKGFAALRSSLSGDNVPFKQQIAEQKKATGVLEAMRDLLTSINNKEGADVFSFDG